MHTSIVVDAVLAFLMLIGGSASLIRMHRAFNNGLEWMDSTLELALINRAWKDFITLGWRSRYHLMTLWNLTCFAAIIHWHMVMSGSVIVALSAATVVVLQILKHRVLRASTLVV